MEAGIFDSSGEAPAFIILPGPYDDDAEAAANGVPVGAMYNNSGTAAIRAS